MNKRPNKDITYSPYQVFRAWADYFRIDIAAAKVRSREYPLVQYKHVLRYLLYNYTELNEVEISDLTAAENRTTVWHSKNVVKDWLSINDDFTVRAVWGILDSLKVKNTDNEEGIVGRLTVNVAA